MMITIDGKQITWQTGMTLDHVMLSLEKGNLFAVVRMNGRLISKPDFASTLVEKGAVIEPIPFIAGG
jgi:thiamine biosynthesis protein ThiS